MIGAGTDFRFRISNLKLFIPSILRAPVNNRWCLETAVIFEQSSEPTRA